VTSADAGSSTSAWVWWLIGIVVLIVAIAMTLLLRRRSRHRAWAAQFTAAEDEVAWFARVLIRQLEQAPTAQQMAGGWTVESGRVMAVEDRLTTLLASALDDAGRGRAGTLRDAVRSARTGLGGLATMADTFAARNVLSSAAAQLEAALAPPGSIAQPPGSYGPPR
jgi:Mg2+ and Co2+ transporter CorA